MNNQTLLEELIRNSAAQSITTTLSREIEKICEEIAREILRDKPFRARIRELITKAFDQTWENMNRESK